jgi:hypothetical protein
MSNDESKVFVIQDDGRKNLSPATNFGEIEVLSRNDLPMFGDHQAVLRHIYSKLDKQYIPGRDYILLTGDPLIIGAVCGFIMKKWDSVRCLKWDRQNFAYNSVEIKI